MPSWAILAASQMQAREGPKVLPAQPTLWGANGVGTITPDESGIPLPWVVLTASGFTVLQVLGVVSDICYG